MINIYLKQAWELLKQNKLFSLLYIVGTGLAIAVTMIMAVVYYVKIAPVYPEVNRMNTLYLSSSRFVKMEDNDVSQGYVSYKALQDWFYPVKNAVAVSARLASWGSNYIQPADLSGDFPVMIKLTDPDFFQIYPFQLLEGKIFTASDLESGIKTVVITDELARRLYGTTAGVIGRPLSLDYRSYRVCAVIRGGSYLTPQSYAQVYLPYSVDADYKDVRGDLPYLGDFEVTFLVKDSKQADALREEIKEIVRRENLIHTGEWQVGFWEQPISHLFKVFKPSVFRDFNVWDTVRMFLLVLTVLLMVPALNLSGMIASRMESRLSEMAVRKSFGAGKTELLSQILWENLLLTLLGGLLGLILAWSVLYMNREWVFYVLDQWHNGVPKGATASVSGEMLFAPMVFLAALLLCVILNLLSALIPTWHSLRKPIVNALNEKR